MIISETIRAAVQMIAAVCCTFNDWHNIAILLIDRVLSESADHNTPFKSIATIAFA